MVGTYVIDLNFGTAYKVTHVYAVVNSDYTRGTEYELERVVDKSTRTVDQRTFNKCYKVLGKLN